MPEQEWNPALFLLIHSPEANSSIVTILARQRGGGKARGGSLIFACYDYLGLDSFSLQNWDFFVCDRSGEVM